MFAPKDLAQCLLFESSRILAMAIVDFLIQALARHSDLFGIDHDHEITTLEMWREGRFVFAAQDLRNLRCQAAQDLSLGVDDVPLWFQVSGLSTIGLHHKISVLDTRLCSRGGRKERPEGERETCGFPLCLTARTMQSVSAQTYGAHRQ